MSNVLKVPFGSRNGILVEPADLESGLHRDCVCPGCGDLLIVRKGEKRPHFAHYRQTPSEGCIETALHAAAKQVLLEARSLYIPEYNVTAFANGLMRSRSSVLFAAGHYAFASCTEEQAVGDIRPDILAHFADPALEQLGPLAIEIFVTHAVDADKRRKIEAQGLAAIEINLRDLRKDPSLQGIRHHVIEVLKNKQWLHHPGAAAAKERLYTDLMSEIAQEERERRNAVRIRENLEAEREQREAQERRRRRQERLGFRMLSLSEKEQGIRRRLGFGDQWPQFLNVDAIENPAISAPAHLWQGALFARFIYKQFDRNPSFQLDDVMEWIEDCFPVASDNRPLAIRAVTRFLGSLIGFRFVRRQLVLGDNPSITYSILHDGASPPLDKHAGVVLDNTPGLPSEKERDPTILGGRRWRWTSSRTDGERLVADLRGRDSTDQTEVALLECLGQGLDRTMGPVEFARKVEECGGDMDQCLELLRSLMLAVSAKVGIQI